MTYKAPVSELRFLFENVVDIERLAKTERFAEATKDLRDAILSEGAKLAEEVLAPLNRNGFAPGLS